MLCVWFVHADGCQLSSEEGVIHQHSEVLAKMIAVGLADSCSQVLRFNSELKEQYRRMQDLDAK